MLRFVPLRKIIESGLGPDVADASPGKYKKL